MYPISLVYSLHRQTAEHTAIATFLPHHQPPTPFEQSPAASPALAMADSTGHGVTTGTNSTPQHLNTDIESGEFNEKHDAPADTVQHTKKPVDDDEEEDEDMDALIDELESQDGHLEEEEEEAEGTPGGGRVIPEDQLQTDTRTGLTEAEVHIRRKKYGLNQMKEEKENLILKFLGYFVGPIQFVMEVSDGTTFLPAMQPTHCGGFSTLTAVAICHSVE